AGGHRLAVGGDGDGGDGALVPLVDLPFAAGQRQQLGDVGVGAGGDEGDVVGVEGDGGDLAAEALDAGAVRPGLAGPGAHVLGRPRRRDPLAVRRVGDAVDVAGVACEVELDLAGGEVVEADLLVEPADGDELPVGAEGDSGDRLGVAGERLDVLA